MTLFKPADSLGEGDTLEQVGNQVVLKIVDYFEERVGTVLD